MFSNLKRSRGSTRASPLKNYLLFKMSSLSQSCISPLLTPPFLISFFFLSLKFKCDAFPSLCCPRSHPREPRKTLPPPDIPNNSGRACGCALNLPLCAIKFNDLLSLLWQRNKRSSSLGRCFPNIGFALFTALSVFGRPVITQEINISSVFKVIHWTFT